MDNDMNKLDVALKLLRLLNERKALDSRIVAGELDVSLRTAQRYLLELSALPCVITDEMTHTYSLNPDYPLKKALVRQPDPQPPAPEVQHRVDRDLKLSYLFCLNCGNARNCDPELSLLLKSNGKDREVRHKVGHLLSLIRRRIKERKCVFP